MEPPKKSWADQVEEEEKADAAKAAAKPAAAAPAAAAGDVSKVASQLAKVTVKDGAADDDDEAPAIRPLIGKEDDESVVIDPRDPTSPLHSVKSFEELGLAPEILKGVYAMGFSKPSKIQEAALPITLGTKDRPAQHLIAQAQSGTGKTAAFTISMLSKVDPKLEHAQAMCVVPSRELARQIFDVLSGLGKFTSIKPLLVVPDEEVKGHVKSQICIGTPGRFADLIKKEQIDMKKIRMFVLDEADHMIDISGLKDQTMRLQKMCPKTCQFLLFSATYRPDVAKYAEEIVPAPHGNIKLTKKELLLKNIQQLWIDCGSEQGKFDVLSELYSYMSVGQSIIFTQRRETVKSLSSRMTAAGHVVSIIHGADMKSEDRDRTIDDFRNGKTKVLISTNLLARGIDILTVSLVVNYDLPLNKANKFDPETYIHRIGRTGRWTYKGIAINFVHDKKSRDDLASLEGFFGIKMKELKRDQLPDVEKILKSLRTAATTS